MDDKKGAKGAEIFRCIFCDYTTSRKYHYDRHLLTAKHQKDDADDVLDDKKGAKGATSYFCHCGKTYKHRQGLWKHQKTCKNEKNDCSEHKEDTNELKMLTTLVMDVVKQNKELTQQNSELTNKIVDICKNTQQTNILQSNINSNNKTFNLNLFLNEECKDAMNITDFVDSVKLQLSDLESIGKLGYVEGIATIIVKQLKALDIHKRPVHCSDSKREVMYIKDENKWEKENDEKKHLRKVIKKIAHKNSKLLPQFKEKYPDCGRSDSKYSDQYNKLIIEAMGGLGDNDIEKEDKIIRKIAKEVIIDKTMDNSFSTL
jgi:hypothetical protein